MGVAIRMGICATKVIVAKSRTEPVSSYTNQLMAICCIHVPTKETHIPVKYNLKFRIFRETKMCEILLPTFICLFLSDKDKDKKRE